MQKHIMMLLGVISQVASSDLRLSNAQSLEENVENYQEMENIEKYYEIKTEESQIAQVLAEEAIAKAETDWWADLWASHKKKVEERKRKQEEAEKSKLAKKPKKSKKKKIAKKPKKKAAKKPKKKKTKKVKKPVKAKKSKTDKKKKDKKKKKVKKTKKKGKKARQEVDSKILGQIDLDDLEIPSLAQKVKLELDFGQMREPDLDEDANGMFEGTDKEIRHIKIENHEALDQDDEQETKPKRRAHSLARKQIKNEEEEVDGNQKDEGEDENEE